MLQPDNFVISNISKHLAQKKTPHFLSWNLNWKLSYFKQCKQQKKSIPNDKNKTHTTILQSKK